MISLICEILKRKHRKRDQICGYQRWRWEEGELEEGLQNLKGKKESIPEKDRVLRVCVCRGGGTREP